MKKVLSLVLSICMLFTCIGAVNIAFAEESNPWAEMFAEYYYGAAECAESKVYPVSGSDFYYDTPSATVTTLFDKSLTVSEDSLVMVYVVNTMTERIGTASDEEIITDLLSCGYIVLVADYHSDPRAITPTLDWAVQKIRNAVKNGTYISYDGMTDESETAVPYSYVLPAGYNIVTDEIYWSIDKHSADGILERIVEIWNSDFKGVHGSKTITLPDGTTTTVSEYTGDGIDSIFECIGPDGEFIDMDLRMDIIYPVNPANKVPVLALASSSEYRQKSWEDVGNPRPHLSGYLFDGYAGVLYDYAYVPMARTDHYNYFDGDSATGHVTGDNKTYSVGVYNHSKCDTAAMRKIRHMADAEPGKFNFDADAIGVFGNSKSGLVTRLGNPNPEKLTEWRFLPGHHGETRYEAGKTEDETMSFTYGDTTVTRTVRGGEPQPWLTYSDGSTIPSNANFVYANCGGGAETIVKGNAPMYVTGTMSSNGSYYDFAPMVMSACYNNDVPVMYYANPGVGHAYGRGLDRDHGQDIYHGHVLAANYYLKGDPVRVAYIEPANDAGDVDPKSVITVKFIGQVSYDEIQKVTVTGNDGSKINGIWKSSYGNTTWEFYPNAMSGGVTYTVTVPGDLTGENGLSVEESFSQSFTTWPSKNMRASKSESTNGTNLVSKSEETENGLYVVFDANADDFASIAKAGLRFYVNNNAANTAEIYALESIDEENLTASAVGEKLDEIVLIGEGEYEADISSAVSNADGKLGFVIKAKKKTESVVISSVDFESASVGATTVNDITMDNAAKRSVQVIASSDNADNQAIMFTTYNDTTSTKYPERLPWVANPAILMYLDNATKSSPITEDDYGRLFRFTMDTYDTKPEGRNLALYLGTNNVGTTSGIDDVDLKQKRFTFGTKQNEWTTSTFDCRIDNPLYWDVLQKQRLRFDGDTYGTADDNNPVYPFYIDNVKMTEEITDIEVSAELSALNLAIYNTELTSTDADRIDYVQNGSKADTSFENADSYLVSAANKGMSGTNKKTYARIPVASFDEQQRAGVSIKVTEGGGDISVYGIKDADSAKNWTADSINYINAYANDRYGYSVDISKVYGGAPVDTLNVKQGGTYTFDITDYMAYMKSIGAEYATVIFIMDSKPAGVVITKDFDTKSSITKNAYADYNGSADIAFTGFDASMNPGSFGTYGVFLDDTVNYGTGSGKSVWMRANATYSRVKFAGLFGDLTDDKLGKTYRVSFMARTETAGSQLKLGLYSSGKGSSWTTTSYQDEETVTINQANTWQKFSYDVTVTKDLLESSYTATDSLSVAKQVPGLLGIIPYAKDVAFWVDDIVVEDISDGNAKFEVISSDSEQYYFIKNFDDIETLKKWNRSAYNSANDLGFSGCSTTVQSSFALSTDAYGGSGKSFSFSPDATYCLVKFPGLLGNLDSSDIGTTYKFSFWAKTSESDAYIQTGTYAGYGNDYSTKTYTGAAAHYFTAANTWQQFTYEITIDENMLPSAYTDFTHTDSTTVNVAQQTPAMLGIVTSGLKTGTLWIDEIEVEAVPKANTLNYSFNRTFDEYTSLKRLYNTAYNNAEYQLAYVGCSPESQATMTLSDSGHIGKALEFQPDTTSCRLKFPGLVGTLDSSDEGVTYKFSFWAKTTEENGSITVGSYSSGSGTAYNTKSYTPEQTYYFDAPNKWQKFTYEYTVDENMLPSAYTEITNSSGTTVSVDNQVPAMLTVTTSGVSAGTLWIDEIEVEAKTRAESGKILYADMAASICSSASDGTTGASREAYEDETSEGIRKTFMSFANADLTNLYSAALELDIASAVGQNMYLYAITGNTYPSSALTWNTAPANIDGTGLKGSEVFGAKAIAEIIAQSGTMKVDVTDYIVATDGDNPIFGLTTDNGGGKEFINLDFETFALTEGVDYVSDSGVNADGELTVDGTEITLRNIFGNSSEVIPGGQTYTVSADITASADSNLTLAFADKDGANSTTIGTVALNGGETKTVTLSYTSGDEDAAKLISALKISGNTPGFSVDNVTVSSDSPVVISGARLVTSNAAEEAVKLAITGAAATKTESGYDFDVTLSTKANGEIIAALYDEGGALAAIDRMSLADADSAKFSVQYTGTASTAKVFLWNTLSGTKPLCASKAITVNNQVQ